jgi:hypothetical protein
VPGWWDTFRLQKNPDYYDLIVSFLIALKSFNKHGCKSMDVILSTKVISHLLNFVLLA